MKTLRVNAQIKNAHNSWAEDFDFESNATIEQAEAEIKEVIVRFNNTLRKNEMPREFVEIISHKIVEEDQRNYFSEFDNDEEEDEDEDDL